MKNRKERLARAAAISDKLWRLQQMRLSAAERKLAELRAAEGVAFEFLGHLEPSLILPHIADLGIKRFAAQDALFEAQERARDYGRRAKLTKKLQKTEELLSQREEADAILRHFAAGADVSAG